MHLPSRLVRASSVSNCEANLQADIDYLGNVTGHPPLTSCQRAAVNKMMPAKLSSTATAILSDNSIFSIQGEITIAT